ncbi:MAG: DUF4381 domain-containing protein [Desulfuromonadales bacterium]
MGGEVLTYPERWGNDSLAGVVEVQPPTVVSWYPTTPGWIGIGVVLLALLGYALARRLVRYRENAYRRAALVELDHLVSEARFSDIPRLLRRTALYAYRRPQVTRPVGAEWETWLDAHCPGSSFATRYQGSLSQLGYQTRHTTPNQELVAIGQHAAHWIRHHKARE